MKTDGYACLAFNASWNAAENPAAFGWLPGPLPIPLPVTSGTRARGGTARVTDRESRSTYFAQRVHNLLYGDPLSTAKDSPQRWHIPVETTIPDVNGSHVQAWEMLADGVGRCLAVAHVQLGSAAATALSALTVVRGPGREWLTSSLAAPLELAD